jgi:hypothetical protein
MEVKTETFFIDQLLYSALSGAYVAVTTKYYLAD